MQKKHIFRCDSFSSAHDFCCILDAQVDLIYTVRDSWHIDNHGIGYVEYVIEYFYEIDGE